MLCEHCNRLISLTDTVCPYCGKAQLHESSSSNEISPTVISEENNSTLSSENEPVPETTIVSSPISAEVEPVNISPVEVSKEKEVVGDASIKKHALESSVNPGPREKNVQKASRFLIAIAILSVIALFSSIVLFILLPLQKQMKQDSEIIGYLEGDWISDYFGFFDSTEKKYVEVLTIDNEGNFTMMYTIPDEAYADGWSTGKWKIIEQIDGKIEYEKENLCLLLLYEDDGVKGGFERFFIDKEDNMMCLREYYDETGNSFYDVILHRIKYGVE